MKFNFGLFYEKFHPFFYALLLGFGFYYLIPIEGIVPLTERFFDYSLKVSLGFAGFFLGVNTLIHAIETRRIRFVKESGNFGRMERYLANTILWHFIVIIIVMLSTLLYPLLLEYPLIVKGLVTLQFSIVSFAMLISLRFTIIFLRLITQPN